MKQSDAALAQQDQLRTRFILIEPSHGGNVGACARALKVMGFNQLALVKPRWPNVLKLKETIERASGANDVLASALQVDSLEDALPGMTHLCATVMTARDFGPPTSEPRPYLEALLDDLIRSGKPLAENGVAFLFGPERYGMSNEHVYRCHIALRIPSNPTFGSLNLASAVQLIAYDWRQVLRARGLDFDANDTNPAATQNQLQKSPSTSRRSPADAVQIDATIRHWEQALIHMGFLNPNAPKKLMARLTQLLNRAGPTTEEIDILRGIARAMEHPRASDKPRSKSSATNT
jgi:tRNA/rRNA methyltransferase